MILFERAVSPAPLRQQHIFVYLLDLNLRHYPQLPKTSNPPPWSKTKNLHAVNILLHGKKNQSELINSNWGVNHWEEKGSGWRVPWNQFSHIRTIRLLRGRWQIGAGGKGDALEKYKSFQLLIDENVSKWLPPGTGGRRTVLIDGMYKTVSQLDAA